MSARPGRFRPDDLRQVDYGRFILAKEGNHSVALLPVQSRGYRYALLYFQPVTGRYVVRSKGGHRNVVLAVLWRLECSHAALLGWPDDPRFGLQLYRLISGPDYPDDVSELTAAEAAAIPHGLEWGF